MQNHKLNSRRTPHWLQRGVRRSFPVMLILFFCGFCGLWMWQVWHSQMPRSYIALFAGPMLVMLVCLIKYYRDELQTECDNEAKEANLSAMPPKPSVIVGTKPQPNTALGETVGCAPGIQKSQERSNKSEYDRNDGELSVHDALATPNIGLSLNSVA